MEEIVDENLSIKELGWEGKDSFFWRRKDGTQEAEDAESSSSDLGEVKKEHDESVEDGDEAKAEESELEGLRMDLDGLQEGYHQRPHQQRNLSSEYNHSFTLILNASESDQEEENDQELGETSDQDQADYQDRLSDRESEILDREQADQEHEVKEEEEEENENESERETPPPAYQEEDPAEGSPRSHQEETMEDGD